MAFQLKVFLCLAGLLGSVTAMAKPSTEEGVKAILQILDVPMRKTDFTGSVILSNPESRGCRVTFNLPRQEIEVRYFLLPEEPEQLTAIFKFNRDSLKKVELTEQRGLYLKAERFAWVASARFEIWLKPVSETAVDVEVKAEGWGFMNQKANLSCQIPAKQNLPQKQAF